MLCFSSAAIQLKHNISTAHRCLHRAFLDRHHLKIRVQPRFYLTSDPSILSTALMSLILRGSDCFKPSQQSCIFSPTLTLHGACGVRADAVRQEDSTVPLLGGERVCRTQTRTHRPLYFPLPWDSLGIVFFSSSLLG